MTTSRPSTVACALLLLPWLAACAHSTTLETDPPGAEVLVDGVPVGVTPFPLEDPPGFGDERDVELRKDGYEVKRVRIRQERWVKQALVAGALLAPCTCGLSLLYFVPRSRVMEDQYGWALVRAPAAQGAAPAGAPSSPADKDTPAAPSSNLPPVGAPPG